MSCATRKLPAERTKHAGMFARTRTHRSHELAPSPVVLVSLIESEDRARYARHCHARGASVFEDRVTRALSAHFNSLVLGRTNWYAYNNKCKFCAWTRVYRLLALKVICGVGDACGFARASPYRYTKKSYTDRTFTTFTCAHIKYYSTIYLYIIPAWYYACVGTTGY